MTIQLSSPARRLGGLSLRNATLALAAGVLSIAACSGSTTTDPGTMPGQDSGTGGGDGSPMDDGSTASDSGTVADSGSSDTATQGDTGGPKPFGGLCATNSDCVSNVCFMGGMGSYCSMHCTAATQATDCPNPPTSGRCNSMGYCKK